MILVLIHSRGTTQLSWESNSASFSSELFLFQILGHRFLGAASLFGQLFPLVLDAVYDA